MPECACLDINQSRIFSSTQRCILKTTHKRRQTKINTPYFTSSCPLFIPHHTSLSHKHKHKPCISSRSRPRPRPRPSPSPRTRPFPSLRTTPSLAARSTSLIPASSTTTVRALPPFPPPHADTDLFCPQETLATTFGSTAAPSPNAMPRSTSTRAAMRARRRKLRTGRTAGEQVIAACHAEDGEDARNVCIQMSERAFKQRGMIPCHD